MNGVGEAQYPHAQLKIRNALVRYCSNLYPKAQSYGACNWCLREEGAKSLAKEAVKDPNTSVSSSTNNDVGIGSSGSAGVELHHRVFSSQFHKPIKRPKVLNRSASDVTDRSRSGELSPGPRRPRQTSFRGKVRRYKLLEEFSS
ncbi:hypothetical protein BHE74_00013014 [Ensete ventricosum]|nr:hypothetical protein BHE74_00013014 [Ensete ventricosum]